jgi:hypothetical protein
MDKFGFHQELTKSDAEQPVGGVARFELNKTR